MFSFFSLISDFFSSLWQMVVNLVSGLVNAIIIVTSATSLPLQLMTLVPSFISASITLVLGVGVIKLIVGWGNS